MLEPKAFTKELNELRSHVVLSSQYEDRPVEPPVADHLIATQHKGWTRP